MLARTPTLCSGVADSQLWMVGTSRSGWRRRGTPYVGSRRRGDDRPAARDGRGTDEEVIAAVEVHVADGGHIEADALSRDIARLEDAQAGIGRLVALGLGAVGLL